ncbi:hypothetical protein KV314_005257, partial [Escherichia coli]|nr:hypothetical protein [Escherichia coli]MEC9625498.1 hypothetical protein [Escherichia marmotae]EHS3109609.1 hypothetical protein [Escherichia coli]EHS3171018.1 hypothetical protein [Escherichia coli]EHS3185879.1 hypothetical protein [Escherichia coli]
ISGCVSDADRLRFAERGSAFMENGKLCIGTKNQKDVVSFYNVGRFGEVFGSVNNGTLVSSGYDPISLRYPDTCIDVNLIHGNNIHYGIIYILNGHEFSYEFDYLPNGTIKSLNK